MAQPSISTSRGEKVSRTQAARLLFTANQSPVAVRPVAASTPSERRSATQCSGLQVGNSTWFTVETKPMGSPTAVVSTSCCKKAEGTTRLPVGKSPVQPATPAFTSRSTPYFRQRISALMAALTFPTPPAQAMISGSISKKGTPESVSKGSQISGRARSSDGMANCSPILMETPH